PAQPTPAAPAAAPAPQTAGKAPAHFGSAATPGDAAPGMTSFDAPCAAGKLISMANRHHAPHGATAVQVLAPDGVAWAMTVGSEPAGEAPPGMGWTSAGMGGPSAVELLTGRHRPTMTVKR
ncbi:MAG: hypothetical protein ACTH8J_14250, partial [Specibacter sp.]